MLDTLYHLFNYTISVCYFIIFLLIFTGLVREKVFGRNALGTATSGIFLTCSLGHLAHASTTHLANSGWEGGLQVIIDGWTVLPSIAYVILRRKYGLIIRGPDMINEFHAQLAEKSAEIKSLHQLEQLKDDFIAMASHELRTPLTTIKGYAQILTRRVAVFGDQKVELAVATINQQVGRMSNLINMLLDVSRIQSHKIELHPEVLDLSKLIDEIVTRLQITSTTHQFNLSLLPHPVWVKIDPERVEQILSNLINNAVKYSPLASRVDITLQENERNVTLQIRDYGSGIDPNELPKVFERFYRSPQVRNSNKEGLGLGLYICQELVRASGGEIRVSSTVGEGSTFTISLLLASAPSAPDYSLAEPN